MASGASECVGRCVGGEIHVQDREFVDQLIVEAEENPTKNCVMPSQPTVSRDSSKHCITPKSRQTGRGCRRYSHISTVPEDDPDFSLGRPWLNSKIVANLQVESNPDCRVTKECYDALLNTEDLYKQDFEYLAMDQMVLNRRRQEMLHKRWSENVYDPIRCEVEQEINGPKFLELQMRKNQLYREYLEHVNRKGHVFLDVFDPVEYFPFSLRPSLLARTDPLSDPLLFQERKRNREDALAFRLATGSALRCKDTDMIRLPILPLVPLGRQGTSWKKWNDMQLGQIDGQVRTFSRRRMQMNRNHSNVSLRDEEDDEDEEFVYVNIKKQPLIREGKHRMAEELHH